jgi:hypothetical protein
MLSTFIRGNILFNILYTFIPINIVFYKRAVTIHSEHILITLIYLFSLSFYHFIFIILRGYLYISIFTHSSGKHFLIYPLFICSLCILTASIQKWVTYSLTNRISPFQYYYLFYHFIFIILRGCLRFPFLHIHRGNIILYTFFQGKHPIFISSLHMLAMYTYRSHPEMSNIFTYQ